eukprot:2854600-Pyramimonas_sp.AAC.1
MLTFCPAEKSSVLGCHRGGGQRPATEGVQIDEPMRAALKEFNKAAPTAMPSGLAVASSSATRGGIAVPVFTEVVAGQPGAVTATDKTKPVGSAETGS